MRLCVLCWRCDLRHGWHCYERRTSWPQRPSCSSFSCPTSSGAVARPPTRHGGSGSARLRQARTARAAAWLLACCLSRRAWRVCCATSHECGLDGAADGSQMQCAALVACGVTRDVHLPSFLRTSLVRQVTQCACPAVASVRSAASSPTTTLLRRPELRVRDEHLLLLPNGKLLHLLPVLSFELIDPRLQTLRAVSGHGTKQQRTAAVSGQRTADSIATKSADRSGRHGRQDQSFTR